jgi:hypothetical protein
MWSSFTTTKKDKKKKGKNAVEEPVKVSGHLFLRFYTYQRSCLTAVFLGRRAISYTNWKEDVSNFLSRSRRRRRRRSQSPRR